MKSKKLDFLFFVDVDFWFHKSALHSIGLQFIYFFNSNICKSGFRIPAVVVGFVPVWVVLYNFCKLSNDALQALYVI